MEGGERETGGNGTIILQEPCDVVVCVDITKSTVHLLYLVHSAISGTRRTNYIQVDLTFDLQAVFKPECNTSPSVYP